MIGVWPQCVVDDDAGDADPNDVLVELADKDRVRVALVESTGQIVDGDGDGVVGTVVDTVPGGDDAGDVVPVADGAREGVPAGVAVGVAAGVPGGVGAPDPLGVAVDDRDGVGDTLTEPVAAGVPDGVDAAVPVGDEDAAADRESDAVLVALCDGAAVPGGDAAAVNDAVDAAETDGVPAADALAEGWRVSVAVGESTGHAAVDVDGDADACGVDAGDVVPVADGGREGVPAGDALPVALADRLSVADGEPASHPGSAGGGAVPGAVHAQVTPDVTPRPAYPPTTTKSGAPEPAPAGATNDASDCKPHASSLLATQPKPASLLGKPVPTATTVSSLEAPHVDTVSVPPAGSGALAFASVSTYTPYTPGDRAPWPDGMRPQPVVATCTPADGGRAGALPEAPHSAIGAGHGVVVGAVDPPPDGVAAGGGELVGDGAAQSAVSGNGCAAASAGTSTAAR